MDDVYLKKWNYAGDKIRLVYEDDSVVFVAKKDFDRAFGCIVSTSKANVVRDFALRDHKGTKASRANGKEDSATPKLISPKRYPEIFRRLRKHLSAMKGKEVKALGCVLDNYEKSDDAFMQFFTYNAAKAIGYPCRLDIVTDNRKVIITEMEMPLFFRERYDSVPDFKLMEHLDSFFEACAEALNLEGFVGPIYDGGDTKLAWSRNTDLTEVNEKQSLKYEDIFKVKLGIGWIVYPSFDAKGNLWLFYIGYSLSADELSKNPDRKDGHFLLGLIKLTKQEGHSVTAELAVN